MFEKIAKWYRQGLWTAEMVNDATHHTNAAGDPWITGQQAAEITGEIYDDQ